MSLKEAYSLAHTAQCKLRLAADRPDRNLRFLVGHAMHLDSLMVRIVEIEESIEQPKHSSAVKFRGAGSSGNLQSAKKSPLAKTSPPPADTDGPDTESDDEEELLDEGEEEANEDLALGLTRFESGSAQPPREPELVPSDGDSSEDEEDYETVIQEVINRKSDGDEFLLVLYNGIQACRCHQSGAPEIERIWELPGGKDGVRTAVAEIKV